MQKGIKKKLYLIEINRKIIKITYVRRTWAHTSLNGQPLFGFGNSREREIQKERKKERCF